MTRLLRRIVLIAVFAAGLAATGAQAHADALCSRVDAWRPVGTQVVCVPTP